MRLSDLMEIEGEPETHGPDRSFYKQVKKNAEFRKRFKGYDIYEDQTGGDYSYWYMLDPKKPQVYCKMQTQLRRFDYVRDTIGIPVITVRSVESYQRGHVTNLYLYFLEAMDGPHAVLSDTSRTDTANHLWISFMRKFGNAYGFAGVLMERFIRPLKKRDDAYYIETGPIVSMMNDGSWSYNNRWLMVPKNIDLKKYYSEPEF